MKITKQRLKEIIKEELLREKDKEGKMAKFDAKETYQDAVDVFKMIDQYDDLPEWLEAKITKASDYMNSVKDYLTHHHSGTNEGKINEEAFSSREAKQIMDQSLREYAKVLRKAQHKIIKDWMSKAKAGVLDFFDIQKGLSGGDMSRAHQYETEFLRGVLRKDKIIDRFRSYFGGRKRKR